MSWYEITIKANKFSAGTKWYPQGKHYTQDRVFVEAVNEASDKTALYRRLRKSEVEELNLEGSSDVLVESAYEDEDEPEDEVENDVAEVEMFAGENDEQFELMMQGFDADSDLDEDADDVDNDGANTNDPVDWPDYEGPESDVESGNAGYYDSLADDEEPPESEYEPESAPESEGANDDEAEAKAKRKAAKAEAKAKKSQE